MKKTIVLVMLFSGLLHYNFAQFNPKSIDIVRDAWGVPHIFAPTDSEVTYGLAWAHAEDDFKTIQGTLAAGKGMAGLLFGKRGAAIDFFTHFIGAYELVETNKNNLDEDFESLLSGYVAGINSYAVKHPEEVLHKRLFPVTKEDMLRAFVLSLVSMSEVDETLGLLTRNKEFNNPYTGIGSNAIAIAANKTVEKETFLAINSHQPFEGPASWYEVHLHSEEGWNILGALFPGSPTVFHGVNENLGWGHTVNKPDMVDIYQLKMDNEEALAYWVDGEKEYLIPKKAKLSVKLLGIPFRINKLYYQSIFGPAIKNKHGYYAVNFSANNAINAVEQWYQMTKAHDFKEFRNSMRQLNLPNFNTVYADKDHNIFFVSNARLPVRSPHYNWKEVVPADTSATLWSEYHTFEELPQYLNPKAGYLYNMNHSPFKATAYSNRLNPGDYPAEMGFLLKDNNRSKRFQQIMTKKSRIDYDTFKAMKFDIQYPESFYFDYNFEVFFNLDASAYPEIADMIAILKEWDRKAEKESVGAGLTKLIMNEIKAANYTESQAVALITNLKRNLLKEYGTIEIPLSSIQVHKRAEKELAIDGLPDVIAPMYTQKIPGEVFKQKAYVGESYILLARFGEGLPKLESIAPYGASSKPESPHYTDQMEMFVSKKLKPMSLNKQTVYEEAKAIYHPE